MTEGMKAPPLRLDFSLRKLNSFRVDVRTKYFARVRQEEELFQLIQNPKLEKLPKFVLGGGSNTLFIKDFSGLVIKSQIKGKRVLGEDEVSTLIEVGGGENWHQLVRYVVNQGWGGIENLALIPGTVGAAPIQNIGAYGQSLADVFDSLDAINLTTGDLQTFDKDACRFAYRESIFKHEAKGRYLITRVRLRLHKKQQLNTSYYEIGLRHLSLKEELESFAFRPYTVRDVYDAVIRLRRKRLPDVKRIPTAGSFFKNPLVSRDKYEELRQEDRKLQAYSVDSTCTDEENVKIPAGRLLDNLGWRGKWIGNVGTFEKHALVVVANGKATGAEILNFTEKMREDVLEHYGIELEYEVHLVH